LYKEFIEALFDFLEFSGTFLMLLPGLGQASAIISRSCYSLRFVLSDPASVLAASSVEYYGLAV
jgi:hypothetical protein